MKSLDPSKSNKHKEGDRNTFEQENYNLLESTLKYYSTSRAAKDFFLHLLAICYCRCKLNRRVVREKANYSRKINKLLSINYLFKKLHLLEILVAKNFNVHQLSNFHCKYLVNMIGNCNDNKEVYDDSNAFIDNE